MYLIQDLIILSFDVIQVSGKKEDEAIKTHMTSVPKDDIKPK